jgi:pentapeptide MXKDX repeat protein
LNTGTTWTGRTIISRGEGENMKKLVTTGIVLCFMGIAVPSFAAPRPAQDQTQQDQMKKDDNMKHDDAMAKDKSKKKMKKDDKMKKDEMKKNDNMKHDDNMKKDEMNKDEPQK